jgi:hypothetical protein
LIICFSKVEVDARCAVDAASIAATPLHPFGLRAIRGNMPGRHLALKVRAFIDYLVAAHAGVS